MANVSRPEMAADPETVIVKLPWSMMRPGVVGWAPATPARRTAAQTALKPPAGRFVARYAHADARTTGDLSPGWPVWAAPSRNGRADSGGARPPTDYSLRPLSCSPTRARGVTRA